MASMRRELVVLIVGACGRIGFGADHGADAGGDDAAPVGRWASVVSGGLSTCGIAVDGTLWCWGLNNVGQLGMGDTTYVQPPAQVGTQTWKSVAIHAEWDDTDHACGIQLDDTLWCWGGNPDGELGLGTTDNETSPRHVGQATWKAISIGDSYTCGLETDGSLWCWGTDDDGELGDGGMNESHVPKQIGASTYIALSAGEDSACAVRDDHTLWCWGDNNSSQLGDNTNVTRRRPVQLAGTTWLDVAESSNAGCGRKDDSSVWCWGFGGSGQLGTGDEDAHPIPVPASVGALSTIVLGDDHACGLDAAGALWCWGYGGHGQLGIADIVIDTPIQIANVHATALSASADNTCIVDDQTRLLCTGSNALGQLALPMAERHVPGRVDARTDWTEIAAQGSTGCGLAGGHAMCWGSNGDGQIGIGDNADDQQQPGDIGTGYAQIVAGANSTAGIQADTTLWIWGYDPIDDDDHSTPIQALVGMGWTSTTVGDTDACAIEAKALHCGGINNFGEVGNGTTNQITDFVVPGSWDAVSMCGSTTCAIATTTGIVSCWGLGDRGQLGNNTTNDASTPQPTTLAAIQVAVGGHFTCALDASRALWCWGANDEGQLGIGTTDDSLVPMMAASPAGYAEVAAGDAHACAIRMDHTLWCWGAGENGEIADPQLSFRSSPTQVGSDTDWTHVATGNDWTCAIKLDGTRSCFGSNYVGELGDGTSWHTGFVAVP